LIQGMAVVGLALYIRAQNIITYLPKKLLPRVSIILSALDQSSLLMFSYDVLCIKVLKLKLKFRSKYGGCTFPARCQTNSAERK
jgi:hypothetical protein